MTNVQLPMQQGSAGDGVSELQYRLLFVGAQIAATGQFDDATLHAVQQYEQHTVGRDPTGVVDDALWERLVADSDRAGYAPAQTFAAGEVRPDDAMQRQMKVELNNLSTRVVALGAGHIDAIDSACANFVTGYAKPRLAQLSSGVTTGGYGKLLARHLTGEAGKEITGLISGALTALAPAETAVAFAVTSVWIGMSMTIERKVGAAVEGALSEQQHLERGLDALVVRMRDEIRWALKELQQNADAQFQAVFDRINNGEELDANTMELVRQIWGAGPQALDAAMHSWFGIPVDDKQLRADCYEALVRAFEEFALEVTEGPSPTSYNPESYSETQSREFDQHRRAREAAEQAAEHLPPITGSN